MSPGLGQMRYRRLRAPRENNSALVDPPLSEIHALLDTNRARMNQSSVTLGGATLDAFRRKARRDLLDLIAERTKQNRLDDDRCLIGSGHQPELFHAGVWFKNWLLARVAAKTNSRATNIVIDNDLVSAPSLKLPALNDSNHPSAKALSLHSIAYDDPADPLPWEERSLKNSRLFKQFGEHVARELAPFIDNPLIDQIWPEVVQAIEQTSNIGFAFTAGRKAAERVAGINNEDLPLSVICDREPFLAFLAVVLNDVEQFTIVYNESLRLYRQTHRLRSETHPAPDLKRTSDAIETPFWLWSIAKPTRGAMFVAHTSKGIVLRNEWGVQIGPLSVDQLNDSASLCEQLTNAGIKIRPRALITTLYLRLVLFDLFIHGIGGAKYDQATDFICEQYFGLKPPAFITATATLHLPLPGIAGEPTAEIRNCNRQLRDLIFNPQRFINDDEVASNVALKKLLDERQSWVDRQPHLGDGQTRRREIARLNESLQPFVAGRRRQVEQAIASITTRQQQAVISASREYSFCLFPADQICKRMTDLLSE